ncbi:hypothetical protein [Streptomyces sp. NPDC053048]|uniref:hypothetical protein n=1 Tax=Streptomyces sp. NPDC053048 TaxID=3365694 RepID=UPI0037D3BC40
MKQASLKALGAAVLGAAFAVAAAGTASAGTLESVTTTATGAAKGVPVAQLAPAVPTGGPALLATDHLVRSGVLEQTAKAGDIALAPHLPTDKLTGPLTGKQAGQPAGKQAGHPAGKQAGHPADNKGNAGLLGALPTNVIAPNGLSMPGLGTPNIR